MKTLRYLRLGAIAGGVASLFAMVAYSPDDPKPGGGEHKVTGISILARQHGTLLKDKNPTQVRVGETIPFRVVASWGIPYVGEVTEKARLTVDPAASGKIDGAGIFSALAPGKCTIRAEVKVTHRIEDEIVCFDEGLAGSVVSIFMDSVDLSVTND